MSQFFPCEGLLRFLRGFVSVDDVFSAPCSLFVFSFFPVWFRLYSLFVASLELTCVLPTFAVSGVRFAVFFFHDGDDDDHHHHHHVITLGYSQEIC